MAGISADAAVADPAKHFLDRTKAAVCLDGIERGDVP